MIYCPTKLEVFWRDWNVRPQKKELENKSLFNEEEKFLMIFSPKSHKRIRGWNSLTELGIGRDVSILSGSFPSSLVLLDNELGM